MRNKPTAWGGSRVAWGGAGTPTPQPTPQPWTGTNPQAIVQYGQSLSVGLTGTPTLTTTNPYSSPAVVLYPASTVDFVESGTEKGVASCAFQIRSQNSDRILSVDSVGVPARTIAELTDPSLFDSRFKSAMDTLDAWDSTAELSVVPWIQGEQDAVDQVAEGYYSGALDTLQSALTTEAQARLGGQGSRQVLLAMIQMSSATQQSLYPLPIHSWVAIEQFEKWRDGDRSKFLLVGPQYCHATTPFDTSGDGVHLRNTSYRHMGELIGQALYQTFVLGTEWKPLHIIGATVNGDGNIVVTFSEPIEVDTTACTAAWSHQPTSTLGFDLDDPSPQPARIESASKTGPSEITCVVRGELHSGSTLWTGRGLRGARMNALYPSTVGNAWACNKTNIRSTDTFVGSESGDTLAKWAVLQRQTITGGAAPASSDGVATNDKTWTAGYYAKDMGATWAPMASTPGAPTLTRVNSGYTLDVATVPFTAGGIGAANVGRSAELTDAKFTSTSDFMDLKEGESSLMRWIGRIDRPTTGASSQIWFQVGPNYASGTRFYTNFQTSGGIYTLRRNNALGLQAIAASAVLPATETWGIIDVVLCRAKLDGTNTTGPGTMWMHFYVNGTTYFLNSALDADIVSAGSFSLFNGVDWNTPLKMPAFCFFGVAKGIDMNWWSPEQHQADVDALLGV